MLQLIRGKVGSWFIKILFVFLILSFAVWGIGDLFRGGGVRATVATVGDERITVPELTGAFQRELGRLQQIFGPTLDVQLALSLGILDQAMEGLVTEALFNQAAGSLGVQAPDSVIVQVIHEEPLFQDRSGRFDQLQFNNFLAATGQDQSVYLAERRRQLARQELITAISAGVTVPESLAEALHRYRNETRQITAILITPESVGEVVAPTEEQLQAHYQEREQSFMAPEHRVLRVVNLTPAHVAQDIEIPEDDVRAQYESQLSLYESQELRAFEQIVVAEEEVATRIGAAVADGLSLADAAGTVDGATVSVIPLELAPRAEFLPALASAGFTLPANGVSAPVQSPFGWHILQVTEIVEGGVSPFETVRAEIEQDLKLDQALDVMLEISDELDDLLASEVDITAAAAQLGLPMTVTPAVARDGSLRDGGVLQDLPALPQVLATGFSIFPDATSTLQETPEEGFYIVRVEQVIAPALRPLDEVRDTVVAGWTAQQSAAAMEALATATAERVDGGGSAAEIAEEIGAAVVEQSDLRRDGANRGALSEELVTSVFDSSVGDVALSPTENGYVVARLDGVTPAPTSDSTTRRDIAAGQTQAIAGDLLSSFAQSLRSQYDVDIDRDSMTRLFQQQPQHQQM